MLETPPLFAMSFFLFLPSPFIRQKLSGILIDGQNTGSQQQPQVAPHIGNEVVAVVEWLLLQDLNHAVVDNHLRPNQIIGVLASLGERVLQHLLQFEIENLTRDRTLEFFEGLLWTR